MRKKKSLYNVLTSLFSYFISMIFTFITQTLIVKILGVEYSGVNGLFTNILMMLSVAEMGIGTAIIFKLYDPIAKDNIEDIKSWMNFYKICYRYVAIVVFILGTIILPFIPFIVGSSLISENLYLLYFISLLDVVFSYTLTYKRSLLYADQKNYVINLIHICYVIFMNLAQIMIILLTKQYLYFLIVKLIFRFFENILINIYVNIHYPYIRDKSKSISSEDKKDILERIGAIFVQKVAFAINKGIDSITISIILGVATVGYYTNYNLIATTLSGIIYQVVSGFIASVGNMLTEKDYEKNFKIYNIINFINSLLTVFFISTFICCIDPFINVWLGNNFILPFYVVISFAIYIYSDSIRRSITIFKEAAGICREDKYVYLIMSFINLIFSVFLCKLIGISGVILGTAISYLFLIFYSYPKYIFAKVFNKSIYIYYKEKVSFIFIMIICGFLSYSLCSLINMNGLLKFIINGLISSIITLLVILIFYGKSAEFGYCFDLIIKFFKGFKRRHKK